jgi:cytochrome P450
MAICYNPFAAGFYENPRPVYQRLRDEDPVHWSPECNFWVLSRYDDVRAAVLNWKVYSNEAGAGSTGEVGVFFKDYPSPLMFDPPRHTGMRRVLATLITPQRMHALREPIREMVRALLDPLAGADGFDLTRDFAEVLPSLVIADLLGVPRADAPVLMQAVEKMADFGQPDIGRATAEAICSLRDYYQEYFRLRAKLAPGDDIIWHLVEAVRDGILAENEALGFAITVTIAGGETTTKMIGNMALLLCQHPEQRRLLVESPDLMRSAIEEALRHSGSTHMMTRTLTEDVVLHGHAMRCGETVALVFNAANNDERKFADPDAFDVRRVIKGDHVAFGAGVHACIGAPLARLEIAVSMEEILARWPNFSMGEGAERYHNPFVSGFRKLPFITGAETRRVRGVAA